MRVGRNGVRSSRLSGLRRDRRVGLAWLMCALAAMGLAQAPAATETVIRAFGSFTHGENPYAPLLRDAAGNLYGTTFQGGAWNVGVVFKLDTSGNESVLYSFCSQPSCADGSGPGADAGVIGDSAGNLYGTTGGGGASGHGVVYKLDTSGTESVLYSFCSQPSCADGANPAAGVPVIRDSAGNLYGTAVIGGSGACEFGCGVVYKVDTSGNESVLYSFKGGADGYYPRAGLIRDSAGNLFGAAEYGGNTGGTCGIGCGVVYKVDTSGNESVLYSFKGGADGANPVAGVIPDKACNLYGTAQEGGKNGKGVLFKLKP